MRLPRAWGGMKIGGDYMRLIDADALVSALNNGRLKEQTGRAVPFNAGVAFALTMVEYAPTIDAVPRWIPCEERLPEDYGLYIATMNDGSVQECSYVPTDYGDVLLNGWSTCEASGFKVLNETDVLAWMPPPEPYEGERKDDE